MELNNVIYIQVLKDEIQRLHEENLVLVTALKQLNEEKEAEDVGSN